MRWILIAPVAAGAAAGALLALRRRRADDWSATTAESYEATPPEERPDAGEASGGAGEGTPDVPFAYESGTVPGPEAREQESEATGETRYDRLGEREQEGRREAAERLREDPLTERLDDGS